jgi:L-asparaginase
MSSSFSKNVVVLGTGGTIAGLRGDADGGEMAYDAAQLGVEQLLGSSDLKAILHKSGLSLRSEQVAQIDSKDMEREVWHALASRCKTLLADPSVAALVITHGTDTMAESAYLLSRLFARSAKPLVLTGAMRPHDDPNADGPTNLRDSIELLTRLLRAQRAGVWVVFDGVLHDPIRVKKFSARALNAFHSFEGDGLKEHIAPDRLLKNALPPHIFEPFLDPMVWSDWTFDPSLEAQSWPQVEILQCHADMKLNAYLGYWVEVKTHKNHTDHTDHTQTISGLILSGLGSGTWPQVLEPQLTRLMELGVRVVLCSQVPWGQGQVAKGALLPHERFHFTTLEPSKARIALMLQLLSEAQV